MTINRSTGGKNNNGVSSVKLISIRKKNLNHRQFYPRKGIRTAFLSFKMQETVGK